MGGIGGESTPTDQAHFGFDSEEPNAGSNQFEIDVMGLNMEQPLDETDQPASPRGDEQKGNISFDEMNQSFN